jgi:hypothetical protein
MRAALSMRLKPSNLADCPHKVIRSVNPVTQRQRKPNMWPAPSGRHLLSTRHRLWNCCRGTLPAAAPAAPRRLARRAAATAPTTNGAAAAEQQRYRYSEVDADQLPRFYAPELPPAGVCSHASSGAGADRAGTAVRSGPPASFYLRSTGRSSRGHPEAHPPRAMSLCHPS